MLYSYAKLSEHDFGFFRFLGSGLGNLLFPWARSVVAAEKYGLKLIEPTWPQIKIGPILRRETDLRFYFDLFSKQPEAVSGLHKIFLLLKEKKISEPPALDVAPETIQNYKNGVFVFSGLKNYFQDILKDNNLIKEKLLEMAKDIHKGGLGYDFTNCASMHIRRGDFKLEKWDTSVEWFLQAADELRNKLGSELKFKIFSDGSDAELAPILRQKNTERVFFGSALADLLAMSQSHILVGSANSTFSMWASYLGRMPTIWPQKGLFQRLHYERPNNEVEIYSGRQLPVSFINNCLN